MSTTSRLVRTIGAWGALLVVLALLFGGAHAVARSAAPPRGVSVYVSPHADDEFQMWGAFEARPDDYQVFVTLTDSSGTKYCDPAELPTSLQADKGEQAPDPAPLGKFTPTCAEARVNSLLGFYRDMSAADPRVPGDFTAAEVFGPYEGEIQPCPVDGAAGDCAAAEDRSVTVWKDAQGRGALVLFHFPDGSLTVKSVTWALQTLIAHKDEMGLGAGLEIDRLIAAYANLDPGAFVYAHNDHQAISNTLWGYGFGAGEQLGATGAGDPRATVTRIVSDAAAEAAFATGADGTRLGAHNRHYGWLMDDRYLLSEGLGQEQLFQKRQSYWVRPAS